MDKGNSRCRLCPPLMKPSPSRASSTLFMCEKESPYHVGFQPAHSHKHQPPPVAYLYFAQGFSRLGGVRYAPYQLINNHLTAASLYRQFRLLLSQLWLISSHLYPCTCTLPLSDQLQLSQSPGCYKLMKKWISDLANVNSFTDSAYSVKITSFKRRKPVKLFHVPFFSLGSGFMAPLLTARLRTFSRATTRLL